MRVVPVFLLRRTFRGPNVLYDHDLGWLFGHRLTDTTSRFPIVAFRPGDVTQPSRLGSDARGLRGKQTCSPRWSRESPRSLGPVRGQAWRSATDGVLPRIDNGRYGDDANAWPQSAGITP